MAISPPFQRNGGTNGLGMLTGKEAPIARSVGAFFIWLVRLSDQFRRCRLIGDNRSDRFRLISLRPSDPAFDVYTFQCPDPIFKVR